MKNILYEALEENPIIAAVKNMDDLEVCCSIADIRVVFILFGDICSISSIVKRLKDAGKIAIVHIDLIVGLSSKEITVDFIKTTTGGGRNYIHKDAIDQTGKRTEFYDSTEMLSSGFYGIRKYETAAAPDKAGFYRSSSGGHAKGDHQNVQGIEGTCYRGRFDIGKGIRDERACRGSDGSFIYES